MATIVPAGSSRLLRLGVLLTALALLTACGSSTTTAATPTATAAPSATAAATATPGVQGYPVKVFFTKAPDSDTGFPIKVFAVNRVSPTQHVETFAVQLLIAGPTTDERAAGYYSELNGLFNGTSQCPSLGQGGVGGPDFILTLNTKGTTPEQGTATLKFCRVSLSGGIGTDARIMAEINATLLQFATIKKVAVLNVQGRCFGDQSGLDGCLQ